MSRQYLTILSSDGTKELESIDFGALKPGYATSTVTFRVFNPSTTDAVTNATLGACRADQTISGPPSEEAETTAEYGTEIVTEKWVEMRIPPSTTWVPVNEYANTLSLGSIAAQGHVTVEARVNTPAGAATFGDTGFCLIARCDP